MNNDKKCFLCDLDIALKVPCVYIENTNYTFSGVPHMFICAECFKANAPESFINKLNLDKSTEESYVVAREREIEKLMKIKQGL